MKVFEYNYIDPIDVLNLNLLSLDWSLTPDLAARIRQV